MNDGIAIEIRVTGQEPLRRVSEGAFLLVLVTDAGERWETAVYSYHQPLNLLEMATAASKGLKQHIIEALGELANAAGEIEIAD